MQTTESVSVTRRYHHLPLRDEFCPEWEVLSHAPLDAPEYCPSGGASKSVGFPDIQNTSLPIYGRAY